jgi:nucleotide-binding universal stress UspA family protein
MKILYATDGSTGAQAAAEFLAALPLDASGHLTILTVLARHEEGEGQPALESAREALTGGAARVETQVRRGHPVEEILRAAEEQQADLLVVGAGGHTGVAHFFVGSVAERVARHATYPVLVARPLRAKLGEVIVGVDGSVGAMDAVEWLQRLPLPAECGVRLLTALPRVEDLTLTSRWLPLPLMGRSDAEAFIERLRQDAQGRLDALAASFTGVGRPAVIEIRSGDAAQTLLDVADEQDADLVVVGSHGLSTGKRFVLGSVSEKILRHAHCSTLVVKH